MTILDRIVAYKREEIIAAKQARPEAELERVCASLPPARGFRRALTTGEGMRVIAEIKRKSTRSGRRAPTGSISPSCKARSSFT